MKAKEIIESVKDKYNIATPWSRTEERKFSLAEVWQLHEHIIVECMEEYARLNPVIKTENDYSKIDEEFKKLLKHED
jgi:hypothetical protein